MQLVTITAASRLLGLDFGATVLVLKQAPPGVVLWWADHTRVDRDALLKWWGGSTTPKPERPAEGVS